MFVRVLGGRDGLSHSGKIVVGNRTQWCERNNFAPPLLEGRAGLFVRDRNTLRGSCELMPFWLKPLLCPSSSSFDHRKVQISHPPTPALSFEIWPQQIESVIFDPIDGVDIPQSMPAWTLKPSIEISMPGPRIFHSISILNRIQNQR